MGKFSGTVHMVAPYTNGHIQFMPLCTNDIYAKIEVFKYNRPSLLKLQSDIHLQGLITLYRMVLVINFLIFEFFIFCFVFDMRCVGYT